MHVMSKADYVINASLTNLNRQDVQMVLYPSLLNDITSRVSCFVVITVFESCEHIEKTFAGKTTHNLLHFK